MNEFETRLKCLAYGAEIAGVRGMINSWFSNEGPSRPQAEDVLQGVTDVLRTAVHESKRECGIYPGKVYDMLYDASNISDAEDQSPDVSLLIMSEKIRDALAILSESAES